MEHDSFCDTSWVCIAALASAKVGEERRPGDIEEEIPFVLSISGLVTKSCQLQTIKLDEDLVLAIYDGRIEKLKRAVGNSRSGQVSGAMHRKLLSLFASLLLE